MRCEELMKRVIECVTPEETVEHAAKRMRDSRIGFLPVCQDTRVLGTITDRDLAIRVVAESRSLKTSIGDIFTREVVACRPEDDLDVAQELMSQHHKSRLMCIDAGGQLVGVISLSDIAQVEVRGATAAQTLRRIAAREVQ